MTKFKKRIKILLYVVLIFLGLPLLTLFLIQSGKVQSLIISNLSEKFSSNLSSKISVGATNISYLGKSHLMDVYIEDIHGDTLFFAKEIAFRLKRFKSSENQIVFKRLTFRDCNINFFVDSSRNANIKYFVDEIRSFSDSSNGSPVSILAQNFELINSELSITRDVKMQSHSKIDFSDMHFNPLNIKVEDFIISDGNINANILNLSTREKSGFTLLDFESLLKVSKNNLTFNDVKLYSTRSQAQMNIADFSFNDFSDFKSGGIFDKIHLHFSIQNSSIGFRDLAYFIPGLKDFIGFGTLSGEFKGNLNKIRGRDIDFSYGEETAFSGDISLDGLPDFTNTFIFSKIDLLKTNPKDLNKIAQAVYKEEITSPLLNKFGVISYKGDFTGFPHDFVSYGEIQTKIGTFFTDILIRPYSEGATQFNGTINTKDVDIGQLTEIESGILGKGTLKTDIKGSVTENGEVKGQIDAKMDQLYFNRYNYSNIHMTGNFDNRKFEGNVNVSDQNLEMEFDGLLNFNTDTVRVNFISNVIRANLYQLNFDTSDPSSFATFYLTANGEGTNIDNLNGEIKLLNSFFYKNEKQVQLYDFSLIANNSSELDRISIRSDFIDANLQGNYKINSFKSSLIHLAKTILPELNIENEYTLNDENNFDFDVELKNVNELVEFFYPSVKIADRSYISGYYKPNMGKASLNIIAPSFQMNSFSWKNLAINMDAMDSNLVLSFGSKSSQLFNSIDLDNFTLLAEASTSDIQFVTRWNNWDTLVNRGEIKARAILLDSSKSLFPKMEVLVEKNTITIEDSLWQLAENKIFIDSSAIIINDFGLKHKDQKISVSGKISENINDQLVIEFDNYNLEGLNILAIKDRVNFSGNLDAKGQLSNFYNAPAFNANLKIDSLVINDSYIGDTWLTTGWSSNDLLLISGNSQTYSGENLNIQGTYNTSNRQMDIDVNLQKFKLHSFHPFLNQVFSVVEGDCKAEINLAGTFKTPLINGIVDIYDGTVKVDYLKTNYFFSERLSFLNNAFIFDQFEFKDSYGNNAIVNGTITNEYLKNYSFNLNVDSENILALNTTLKDNTSFYGKGFASCQADIFGPSNNIEISITGETNKGTQLNIPLSSPEEGVGSYEFISFKSSNELLSADIQNQTLNTSFPGKSRVSFDLELDVNENADVQIIFDSKVGDIIEARGNGNIKLEVNKYTNLNMFGSYAITDGNYLFTLQNLFNKKFEIEPGGLITWNGAPSDAIIDLQASYNLRAPLENLLVYEDSEEYKKRIPIECQLLLKNQLMNPDIQFGINLPTSDPETQAKVQSELTTEEELTKQFLSLILINNFFADASGANTGDGEQRSSAGSNLGKVTTFEMLSNQFSHYLSQWSNDLDVGVYYRPEDEIAAQEFEVELSTKLLNDRVSINTNVEIQGNNNQEKIKYVPENQPGNIVGEFEVDWQVSDNGKVHIKAFNRSNDFYTYRTSEYTQGVALSFREEFDSLKDLWKKVISQNKKENN